MPLRLLVGLGNPASRYARNRHNVGFMALDAIAQRYRIPGFRNRFKGEIADAAIGGERRLLLKPQTYMNDSGESVAETARFFKIVPAEIVVIHDEIDLRPGKLRVKRGGGNAGHNGLRSIDALLGSDYWRVRIGIGHPGVKELVQPYVLQNFPADEISLWVEPLLAAVAETIPILLSDMHHLDELITESLASEPRGGMHSRVVGQLEQRRVVADRAHASAQLHVDGQ